jgi:hypothetical protein
MHHNRIRRKPRSDILMEVRKDNAARGTPVNFVVIDRSPHHHKMNMTKSAL